MTRARDTADVTQNLPDLVQDTLSSLLPTSVDLYPATGLTLTAAQCYGFVLSNRDFTADGTVTLPLGQPGMNVTIIRENPIYSVSVDPNFYDEIDDSGTGVPLVLRETGTTVVLQCYSAGKWRRVGGSGQAVHLGYLQVRTIYVATTGNDSNSGTLASPKLTLTGAMLVAMPGDTIVVRDGTYTGTLNEIGGLTTAGAKLCKGTAFRWITIKAENPGQAIITSRLNIDPGAVNGSWEDLYLTDFFVQFDGLIWNNAYDKVIRGRNLKFFRCGFRGAPSSGNAHTVTIGGGNEFYRGAQHVLMEDCFAWGPGGRYKFIVFNAKDVVLRRCVARWDQGWNNTSFNSADFCYYDSENVEFQNCISIDSVRPSSNADWYTAAFFATRGYFLMRNFAMRGCFAINNKAGLVQVTGLTQIPVNAVPSDMANVYRRPAVENFLIEHCAGAILGNGTDVYNGVQIDTGPVVARNILVAMLQNAGSYGFAINSYGRFVRGSRIEDSVFASATGSATSAGAGTITNQTNYTGGGALATAAGAGLVYPTRMEPSSTLATAFVGPDILKKIGRTGTLYGEPGFNSWGGDTTGYTPTVGTPTGAAGDDLWPFPNEALIKTCMSAAGGFGDVDRDWTAGSLTLTQYVWRALGAVSGPP